MANKSIKSVLKCTQPITEFDICIIGGGVVGLACAYQLAHDYRVLLVERHRHWGTETSSRNSEVIHAGLYYPENSLKETLCLRGKSLLYEFCHKHNVPHRAIGKLVIAHSKNHPKLDALEATATRCHIPFERWGQKRLQSVEPALSAVEGFWSPTTGIIDSHAYMQKLAELAETEGALLVKQTTLTALQAKSTSQVTNNEYNDHIDTKGMDYWQAEFDTADGQFSVNVGCVINCAGLAAQSINHIVKDSDGKPLPLDTPTLYPCRGHYFSYQGKSPFHHLIYPLPEANTAGLGIHATLDLQGQCRFGPDTEYLNELGTTNEPEQNYRIPDPIKKKFIKAIKQYFPSLDENKLQPSYAGIRPKLSSIDMAASDFYIQHETGNKQPMIQCFGIESPGLTSSLAIAEYIQQLLVD